MFYMANTKGRQESKKKVKYHYAFIFANVNGELSNFS